jgi:hypothetical protein
LNFEFRIRMAAFRRKVQVRRATCEVFSAEFGYQLSTDWVQVAGRRTSRMLTDFCPSVRSSDTRIQVIFPLHEVVQFLDKSTHGIYIDFRTSSSE